MSEASEFLSAVKAAQDKFLEATKVCLCNPEMKKYIEQRIESSPGIVFIGNKLIEPNLIIVVEDMELKKTLLEVYEKEKEKEQNEKV